MAWRHHIEPNFAVIGTYFLCQNVGVIAGALVGGWLLRRKGISIAMSVACAAGCAGFLCLAAFSPPATVFGRFFGLFLLGFCAGMVNLGAWHGVTPAYDLHPAATLNLTGLLFGTGCLLSALFLSGTFFVYTVPSILMLLAAPFAFASAVYARSPMPEDPVRAEPTWRQALRDFRSPAAILMALLLFFHLGNEGALSGWLALFLTQRLGASPADSILLLALYWLSLLLGRVLAQWILPGTRHGLLLLGAVLLPMFACGVLYFTNNMFGATVGVLLAGGGFSVILPLVMEQIGNRFPYFHPGFFNGIFSLALTGSLLAPASLGYLAHFFGIGVVMGLPMAGSMIVLFLLLLILLETRLSGRPA